MRSGVGLGMLWSHGEYSISRDADTRDALLDYVLVISQPLRDVCEPRLVLSI